MPAITDPPMVDSIREPRSAGALRAKLSTANSWNGNPSRSPWSAASRRERIGRATCMGSARPSALRSIVLTVEAPRCARRRELAGEEFHQRELAGAVLAEDGMRLAGAESGAHVARRLDGRLRRGDRRSWPLKCDSLSRHDCGIPPCSLAARAV